MNCRIVNCYLRRLTCKARIIANPACVTSSVAIVTPTDRPKLVRNRHVIEVFGGVVVLSRCFLDFSVGVGAFVIGLSKISSFFSLTKVTKTENGIVFKPIVRGACHPFLVNVVRQKPTAVTPDDVLNTASCAL